MTPSFITAKENALPVWLPGSSREGTEMTSCPATVFFPRIHKATFFFQRLYDREWRAHRTNL